MKPRACVALAGLCLAAGCSEPLEFADWTIPVPEGVRVVEYAHVPFDQRGDARIDWVDELVIGDRGDVDAHYAFTYPTGVAVDRSGRIYVADASGGEVRLFDQSGDYLRNLSRAGQGPGEFKNPEAVIPFDDRLVVLAYSNNRLSNFDLQGNHVGDYPIEPWDNLGVLGGRPDGNLVAATWRFTRETGVEHVNREVVVMSPRAEKLREYMTLRFPSPPPAIDRDGRTMGLRDMPNPRGEIAVAADGTVYGTMSDEYQVLAVGPDITPRWALRVAWSPPPLAREQIDHLVGEAREIWPDAREDEINLPARQPAIHRILVDGHGHVYVWPYVYVESLEEGGEPNPLVPVDVYSPTGERLFTGKAPHRYWALADGDHVWELAIDTQSEEWVVRKARLVEPFSP